MSQKFIIRIGVVTLGMFSWLSCDPCRQLATQICECKLDEEERRVCIEQLGLASEHHYFEKAKHEDVCVQAMKDCTCEKINKGDDAKCALRR